MFMSPKFWNISLQLQNSTSYLQNCKLIGWLFKSLTQCHTFIVRPTVEEHCNEGLYFILFLQSGIPHLWLKSEQITQTRGHMSTECSYQNPIPYLWNCKLIVLKQLGGNCYEGFHLVLFLYNDIHQLWHTLIHAVHFKHAFQSTSTDRLGTG